MIAQARDRAKEEEGEEDEENADQTSQASPRRALQRDDDRTQLERDGSLEMMLLLASPQVSSAFCIAASFLYTLRCAPPPPSRRAWKIPGRESSFFSEHTFCNGHSCLRLRISIKLLTIKINHSAFMLIYPLDKGKEAIYKTHTYRNI